MLGTILNVSPEVHLYYILFDDGTKEWIHADHIVGIRRS